MKKLYIEPKSVELKLEIHSVIMASRESIGTVSIESLTIEDDSEEWN
ncbi:MAG: hypothetical protein IKR69_02280 [Bacteroidales bacterium]|nr:hypothetical protein [Bacteroidales bacterium]